MILSTRSFIVTRALFGVNVWVSSCGFPILIQLVRVYFDNGAMGMYVVVFSFVGVLFVLRYPILHYFVCPYHLLLLVLAIDGPNWAWHCLIVGCFLPCCCSFLLQMPFDGCGVVPALVILGLFVFHCCLILDFLCVLMVWEWCFRCWQVVE